VRDPNNFVDAATPAVADILTEISRIVLTGGGMLHPGLTIVERNGAMTVVCAANPDAAPDQPLFEVPRGMLIPVDGALWEDSRVSLQLVSPPVGLTALRRDLLDLHVALYNATDKLPWIVASHPKLGLGDAPDVVSAIRELRPGFTEAGAHPVTTGPPSEPPRPSSAGRSSVYSAATRGAIPPIVEVFLNTRVFGLKPLEPDELAPPDTQDPVGRRVQVTPAKVAVPQQYDPAATSPTKQRVLLPLIDLLNHHPRGASLRVDARAMTPAVTRPTGTTECFAHYGRRRDSLDLALNYGYVDTVTRFVHCPPMTIDVPSVGTLRILGRGSRGIAPFPLDPPRVTIDEDGITLSHIVLRPSAEGASWELPVLMALQARALQLGATPASARNSAEACAAAILERATALLRDLQIAAERHTTARPAAGVLAGAAEHQLRLLSMPLSRR
jgi:hypothetical protein